MFLKHSSRKKDRKVHHYWSIVENRRIAGGRVIQRHVLYLGEINSTQQAAWRKTIDLLQVARPVPRTVALFPEERLPEICDEQVVSVVKLADLQRHHPRQWGGCWLADRLWRQLDLNRFWCKRLPPSRKGTRWDRVLQTLITSRRLDPGSEWRVHRHWFPYSAMAELLGGDFRLAAADTLYRCHDHLLPHKRSLFNRLSARWKDPFTFKLRQARQREGRYLLRTNLTGHPPEQLWEFYLQLVQVEEAFRNLKGDLAIRHIHHQKPERIEAHLFIAFLAYCLHLTLRHMLRPHANGLTPRQVLDKFKTLQLIDLHLPTLDGRTIILPRYTRPEADVQLLLRTLKLTLPKQPPPRLAIARRDAIGKERCRADLFT